MHQGNQLRSFTVLLITISFAAAMGTAQPSTDSTEDEEEWLEMETDKFVVEYKDGYEDDASYIGDVSENAYAELQETFPENVSEPRFKQPIHIRVYPGDRWSRSDYALSWRDTTPVRIHVQAPSDSEPGDDWHEHGLAHELGNIFLWDEAGRYDNYNYFQRNPSWFPEGLTEYYVYNTPTVEDQFPPSGVEEFNKTIAAGDGDFSALASEQYDGGHILSMYLVEKYGEDAVWSLLRNDASSWDDAVQQELGVTKAGLEKNWYRWAQENTGGNYSGRIDSHEVEAEIDELEAELEEKEKKVDELEVEMDEKEKKINQLKAGFMAVIAAFVGIFIALYFIKRRPKMTK